MADSQAAQLELIQRIKYLLEWLPVCSKGSSGDKRRVAVEESLAKFSEDGSLKQSVSVKADLEHPAQAIQGAKSEKPVAPSPAPAPTVTRFNDFDEEGHPFRFWWEKHGQLMLSGGGRRESIWAARGWIAREQLLQGVEVTGDSMHETPASPAQPERCPNPLCRSDHKNIRGDGTGFPCTDSWHNTPATASGPQSAEPTHPERCPIYYVASRASIPARGEMWRRFRSQGVNISATWIDEDGRGETDDFTELWQRLEKEIESSTALLFYVEPNDFPLKGALVEVGMAIAMGRPVLVFHPGVDIDSATYRPLGSWVKHPAVQLMTCSIDEFTAMPASSPQTTEPTKSELDRALLEREWMAQTEWNDYRNWLQAELLKERKRVREVLQGGGHL